VRLFPKKETQQLRKQTFILSLLIEVAYFTGVAPVSTRMIFPSLM
jgi:hypothetical protein